MYGPTPFIDFNVVTNNNSNPSHIYIYIGDKMYANLVVDKYYIGNIRLRFDNINDYYKINDKSNVYYTNKILSNSINMTHHDVYIAYENICSIYVQQYFFKTMTFPALYPIFSY